MVEILSVPLEDAKRLIVEAIQDINQEDVLKYTTVWTKGSGSTKLLKSLIIEVTKNSRCKVKQKSEREDNDDI